MASKTKIKPMNFKWHDFLPAIGGLVITFIFSQDVVLSAEVGIVVLIFTFIAKWVGDR